MDNKEMTINMEQLQSLLSSGAPSKSMAMLNTVMVETLGMSMHNAVTAQHNAQQVNTAATTSTCARILATIGVPAPAPTPTPPDPTPSSSSSARSSSSAGIPSSSSSAS